MSESKCPFCNMTETFRASLEGAESMKVRRAAEFVGQPATYRVMLTRSKEILVCAEHAVGIQRPKHPAPQADANDVPCDGSRFAPDTSLQRCQLPHGHSGPHQYHPTPQAGNRPAPARGDTVARAGMRLVEYTRQFIHQTPEQEGRSPIGEFLRALKEENHE